MHYELSPATLEAFKLPLFDVYVRSRAALDDACAKALPASPVAREAQAGLLVQVALGGVVATSTPASGEADVYALAGLEALAAELVESPRLEVVGVAGVPQGAVRVLPPLRDAAGAMVRYLVTHPDGVQPLRAALLAAHRATAPR